MCEPLLISIITVCYNSVHTIEATIQSVLSQDYPYVEYIIIDGQSTDGTQALLRKYTSRARVVCAQDKGMYDAMNKGIRLAKGEVVGLLHSDDLYAHKKVLSTVARVFSDPSIEGCYGDLIYFSSQKVDKVIRYWRASPFVPGAFAKGWSPPHPTLFLKKTVYSQWGYFNTSYEMGNDIELMMRLFEKHKIKTLYLPEVLVKMRLGGASNRGLRNIFLQNKEIIKAAAHLGIPLSPVAFIIQKVCHRLCQFIFKRVSYNVK